MNKRLSELLPWYVNGTLQGEDRQWVDRYLAEHDDARAELEWYRGLQAEIAQSAPAVPADLGLARTWGRIRGERRAFGERIAGWLGSVGLGGVVAAARPIGALAAVGVIVVQSGVIYSLARHADDEAEQIRALRAVPADDGPLLRVNFAPDAKEADIRLLLSSVEGRLAGGPGQLGDYYVRVPAGSESAARDRLKSHRIVLAVEVVPGLPTTY
ncbi:MAG TPA: hypothetical protein VMU33_06160 [Burkholderiaceae bacterium]|nr:hypothetical protein [Burkholderiaceae bacterium]